MQSAEAEPWWQTFFDEAYIELWGHFMPPEVTARQVEGLWEVLGLGPGARVLDAPCGYGRIAKPLAERGAAVLGVDQSEELLARAEAERGKLSTEQLRYRGHDLREPLDEGGFDVALSIFSSIGYGEEEDDLAIFLTLHGALRRGGRIFVETMHRNATVASFSRGVCPALRLPNGTLMLEDPRFDAVEGRVRTTWHWAGPKGFGQKRSTLRLYRATEIVRLLEEAGFAFRPAHVGCSSAPFESRGPDAVGGLGILAERA